MTIVYDEMDDELVAIRDYYSCDLIYVKKKWIPASFTFEQFPNDAQSIVIFAFNIRLKIIFISFGWKRT